MMYRLQKILSQAGVASRRKSEEFIAAGRVTVNGKPATIGQSADPAKDEIKVDGVRVKSGRKSYVLLYKPKGYVSAVSDNFEKKLVTDLVPSKERLFPIGRLDKDAEGLILLTNDGDFANRVMHPRYEVEKVYKVELVEPLHDAQITALRKGVVIENFKVVPKVIYVSKDRRTIELSIHEGMHKIVKRLIKAVGGYVDTLTRTKIGPLTITGLKRGTYRYLNEGEVKSFWVNTKER